MNDKLNTAVLYGSARRQRQGIKAARFMVNQLGQRGHAVTLVDTQEHELPMLDLMYKEYDEGAAPAAMEQVAGILREADGFVVVSAEYNHSIPAALKNLLDHYQSEYLYKPSAIVTYSAGPFGGVRSLVNLRAILAELGTPSIPSALPVSQIGSAFDDDGNAVDEKYEKRVVKFLDEYEWYARALKCERDHGGCSHDSPTQQQLCRAAQS
ncbi:MAG: NAD(P)H-dependent oxidoreductase [Gammaproteobacteria bacterium]|nr:NAD(P)H-dependent oxidoreductase [Gammaproteobacteria bacterium]